MKIELAKGRTVRSAMRSGMLLGVLATLSACSGFKAMKVVDGKVDLASSFKIDFGPSESPVGMTDVGGENGSMSGTTETSGGGTIPGTTSNVTCTTETTTRNLPCESGMVGSITQKGERKNCSDGLLTEYAWQEVANSCRVAPTPKPDSGTFGGGGGSSGDNRGPGSGFGGRGRDGGGGGGDRSRDCFAPSQRLFVSGGYVPIKTARSQNRAEIASVAPGSTMTNLWFQWAPVQSYSESPVMERDLLRVRTARGGELLITMQHPVLRGDGRLVRADELVIGDELVRFDGDRDAVVSLDAVGYNGAVYNVVVDENQAISNLIVAEGFVTGSLYFETIGQSYMNHLVLRRSLLQ